MDHELAKHFRSPIHQIFDDLLAKLDAGLIKRGHKTEEQSADLPARQFVPIATPIKSTTPRKGKSKFAPAVYAVKPSPVFSELAAGLLSQIGEGREVPPSLRNRVEFFARHLLNRSAREGWQLKDFESSLIETLAINYNPRAGMSHKQVYRLAIIEFEAPRRKSVGGVAP